jgi:hypothetical protein
MQHIAQVLKELRVYIAAKEDRAELEEIDTLLSMALEEVRRKLAKDPKFGHIGGDGDRQGRGRQP